MGLKNHPVLQGLTCQEMGLKNHPVLQGLIMSLKNYLVLQELMSRDGVKKLSRVNNVKRWE